MLFKNFALVLTLLSSAPFIEAKKNKAKKPKGGGGNDPSPQELKNSCIKAIVGPDPATKPDENLYVQTAKECELKWLGGGKTKLITGDISRTFVFTSIPARKEFVQPTVQFVSEFSVIFPEAPNGAITFVSDDDNAFEGPLVAALSNPKLVNGGISYDLEQSPDQNGVLSVESFFKNGNVAKFTDCSLFIDDGCNSGCIESQSVCLAACAAGSIFNPGCDIGCRESKDACTAGCNGECKKGCIVTEIGCQISCQNFLGPCDPDCSFECGVDQNKCIAGCNDGCKNGCLTSQAICQTLCQVGDISTIQECLTECGFDLEGCTATCN